MHYRINTAYVMDSACPDWGDILYFAFGLEPFPLTLKSVQKTFRPRRDKYGAEENKWAETVYALQWLANLLWQRTSDSGVFDLREEIRTVYFRQHIPDMDKEDVKRQLALMRKMAAHIYKYDEHQDYVVRVP